MTARSFARQIGFSTAAVLLAASTVFAQQPGGGGVPGPGGQPQEPVPQTPGGPGMASPGSGQTDMQKMADQSFVRNTLENNVAQVRLSQLAEQKSSSPDVKQFGTQMVKAHTQLDSQLQPVAKQLGVDEPKGPSKKDKKEVAKLEALSGPSFEAEYLQAMAREQQESLKYFHDAQDSQSPDLQQAAKLDTPILTQHFQALKQIARAHNVELEAKEKK